MQFQQQKTFLKKGKSVSKILKHSCDYLYKAIIIRSQILILYSVRLSFGYFYKDARKMVDCYYLNNKFIYSWKTLYFGTFYLVPRFLT